MSADPLGFMKRLSRTVTYYEPSGTSIAPDRSNMTESDPDLVLLSTWMGAKESHIAKYVQEYRKLFPASRILVAQCPFAHVVMPFLGFMHIRPAVPILNQITQLNAESVDQDGSSSLASEKSARPRVLIHAFSNGGISTVIFLYNALKRSLGGTLTLPRHVFIFDSCPGTFKWRNTARAIMKILPRWTSPVIHAVLFSIWLIYRIVPVIQPRQNINSRLMRNPRLQRFEARRTYVYGTEDELIPSADVEHEAALAAEAGFNVRLERFDDAIHVAIPMLSPERYWRVVKESWHGQGAGSLTGVVVRNRSGEVAGLKAGGDSEVVDTEICLEDYEETIGEEASILVDVVKSDASAAVKRVI